MTEDRKENPMAYNWRHVKASGNRTSNRFSELPLGDGLRLQVHPIGNQTYNARLTRDTDKTPVQLWQSDSFHAGSDLEADDIALKRAFLHIDHALRRVNQTRRALMAARLSLSVMKGCDSLRLSERLDGDLYIDVPGHGMQPVDSILESLAILAGEQGCVDGDIPACALIPGEYLTDSGRNGGDTCLDRSNPKASVFLSRVIQKLTEARTTYLLELKTNPEVAP